MNYSPTTIAHRFFDWLQQSLGILQQSSPEAAAIAQQELAFRTRTIPLIASENIVSPGVAAAMAFTPLSSRNMESNREGEAFYEGENFAQKAQALAINNAKRAFHCEHANVQPFSGSIANAAILMALMPKDGTILSMSMADGGHFTQGDGENFSGKFFKTVGYGVNRETGLIDYDEMERLAVAHRPSLIIVGGSSYPREIDFKRVREIADKAGALVMADISHYAGLIAAGEYRHHPFDKGTDGRPFADVAMSTTHKCLRGPRGAVILWNDDSLSERINNAVFPGIQGEPNPASMLAKAVAFEEAGKEDYKRYARAIKSNAHTLAESLKPLPLITGGTDTHMVTADVSKIEANHALKGDEVAASLARAGLIVNKMPVPGERDKAHYSGVRIGTPAATTLGLGEQDFRKIGGWIKELIGTLAAEPASVDAKNLPDAVRAKEEEVRTAVEDLCKQHEFAKQLGAKWRRAPRHNLSAADEFSR